MVKMEEQYINIPYSIMSDKRLNQTEKMVYGLIKGFDDANKICYASNRHIAEVIGVSERQVSRSITKLTTTTLVSRFEEGGRKRWLTTTSKTPTTTSMSNYHDTDVQLTTTPMSNNNIVDNIKNNIIYNIEENKNPNEYSSQEEYDAFFESEDDLDF